MHLFRAWLHAVSYALFAVGCLLALIGLFVAGLIFALQGVILQLGLHTAPSDVRDLRADLAGVEPERVVAIGAAYESLSSQQPDWLNELGAWIVAILNQAAVRQANSWRMEKRRFGGRRVKDFSAQVSAPQVIRVTFRIAGRGRGRPAWALELSVLREVEVSVDVVRCEPTSDPR
jgi:hypothetical protein